jgi:hypothetical protein
MMSACSFPTALIDECQKEMELPKGKASSRPIYTGLDMSSRQKVQTLVVFCTFKFSIFLVVS